MSRAKLVAPILVSTLALSWACTQGDADNPGDDGGARGSVAAPDSGAGGSVAAPDSGAGGSVAAPDSGAGGSVAAPDSGAGGSVAAPDSGAGGSVAAPDSGASDVPSRCDPVRQPDADCAQGTPRWSCAPDPNGGAWTFTCPGPSADGPATDAAVDGTASDGGVPCGSKFCTGDYTCCNASCGICAPPGAGCAAMVCDLPATWACNRDSDCTLVSDYCTGCDCRVLGPGGTLPTCTGPGVRCFADPCLNQVARCRAGRCLAASSGEGQR